MAPLSDNNTTSDEPDRIASTTKWLEEVVIGLDLCPFAAAVYRPGRLTIEALRGDPEDCLLAIVEHLEAMRACEIHETLILVLPDCFSDFDDYLQFIATAEEVLVDRGYEGQFQLASFHPDYRFAGEAHDDPANYTNRSPYPLVHILRESSVTRAVDSHGNPQSIPERNQRITRDLGLQKMQQLFEACKQAE